MSLFDPHSIYKNRQRASKRGQVLQKKPMPLPRAYNKADLEEAYRVLKAYGIPYGPQPVPPPVPPPPTPPQNPLVNVISYDVLFSKTDTWETSDTIKSTTVTDKEILGSFFTDSEYGQWLTTELDLSKVVNYSCAITSKNISYYYDAAGQPSAQPKVYSMQTETIDRMSNFTLNTNFESFSTGTPSRYISKSMQSDWNMNPYYVLDYNNLVNGQSVIDRETSAKAFSNAYEIIKSNQDLTLSNLINGNYVSTTVATTATWSNLSYDTAIAITSIATVYFYVEYNE